MDSIIAAFYSSLNIYLPKKNWKLKNGPRLSTLEINFLFFDSVFIFVMI